MWEKDFQRPIYDHVYSNVLGKKTSIFNWKLTTIRCRPLWPILTGNCFKFDDEKKAADIALANETNLMIFFCAHKKWINFYVPTTNQHDVGTRVHYTLRYWI